MSAMMDRPIQVGERFEAKVERVTESGCWLWMAGIDRWGYGWFKMQGKKIHAHIAAYRLFVGKVPQGLELDHLCRVPCCVNPAHLEPVTHRTNQLRGTGPTAMNIKKTACMHGHPFDAENTYFRKNGNRTCRTCTRESVRKYDQRKRAELGLLTEPTETEQPREEVKS